MRRKTLALLCGAALAAGALGGTAAAQPASAAYLSQQAASGNCSADIAPNSKTITLEPGSSNFDAGVQWDSTFANTEDPISGVAVQNWNSGLGLRPWVGLRSGNQGRLISATVEFTVEDHGGEAGTWTIEKLPVGNTEPSTTHSFDTTAFDASTGSFTASFEAVDGARQYAYRAGWALHADGTNTDGITVTITMRDFVYSPLEGENSNCQDFAWEGTPVPVLDNGTPGVNGVSVNVAAGDAERISGIVTDAEGAEITDAVVTVDNAGAVSVSLPNQSADEVTVQLTADGEAFGEPFTQPIIRVEPTIVVENGAPAGGYAPALLGQITAADGTALPEGTYFWVASFGSPDAQSSERPRWITVDETGVVSAMVPEDFPVGVYALTVGSRIPSGQVSFTEIEFEVLEADGFIPDYGAPGDFEAGDDEDGSDEATEGEAAGDSDSASESGTEATLPRTGADSTLLTAALVLAAMAAAGGAIMLRRRA